MSSHVFTFQLSVQHSESQLSAFSQISVRPFSVILSENCDYCIRDRVLPFRKILSRLPCRPPLFVFFLVSLSVLSSSLFLSLSVLFLFLSCVVFFFVVSRLSLFCGDQPPVSFVIMILFCSLPTVTCQASIESTLRMMSLELLFLTHLRQVHLIG